MGVNPGGPVAARSCLILAHSSDRGGHGIGRADPVGRVGGHRRAPRWSLAQRVRWAVLRIIASSKPRRWTTAGRNVTYVSPRPGSTAQSPRKCARASTPRARQGMPGVDRDRVRRGGHTQEQERPTAELGVALLRGGRQERGAPAARRGRHVASAAPFPVASTQGRGCRRNAALKSAFVNGEGPRPCGANTPAMTSSMSSGWRCQPLVGCAEVSGSPPRNPEAEQASG